jgi:UDP-N-acetylmuramoylalanine--D-glutamate ligase
LSIRLADLAGLRVTVMGLGLHGGGLASCLFFARHGSQVTVTDNRKDPAAFAPVLPLLERHGVRMVLGRHEIADFVNTDLVIKNPAVPADSPYLAASRDTGIPVESDLSVFLQVCHNPVVGITGSKGKSTTASAIHHCLRQRYPGARLGGNITVNPLGFLEEMGPADPVVLELSSWQLADLRGSEQALAPQISLVTVILPDHQNKYPDMASYLADKMVLFQSQRPEQYALFNHADPYQAAWSARTRARVRWFSPRPLPAGVEGAWLRNKAAVIREAGSQVNLSLANLRVPGEHNRLNLLAAALACHLFGLPGEEISASLASFPGLEHRLEPVVELQGVRFYNDSAATIPEAVAAALAALPPPLLLITGGTDKNLNFRPLLPAITAAEGVFLLEGSATGKLRTLLEEAGKPYAGPYASLEQALEAAWAQAKPGATILFSPGCASFEMFLNEFDRGRKFKELVRQLADRPPSPPAP